MVRLSEIFWTPFVGHYRKMACRLATTLVVLLLVGEAVGARPCEQAAGGKPCPENDATTLESYLRSSGGVHRHSYNLAMDEDAFMRQQSYQPLADPTPVSVKNKTPGPTPAGLPYWKSCSHVSCDWIDDHHVTVYHR